MTKNTLVTDSKIDWLSRKGYLVVQKDNGATSYYLTEKGKAFLNDKKAD